MAVRAPGERRGVAEGSGPGTLGPPAGTLQEHFLGLGRTRSGFAAPAVKPGSEEEVTRVLRASAAGAGLPRCGGRVHAPLPFGATALSFLVKWETLTTPAGRSVAAAHPDEPSKQSFSPFLSEFPERSEEKEP